MSELATIQWYPGHMARAMRRLHEDLRLIDVVIEVVDARVPRSGRNPQLAKMTARLPHLLVLSRADLASPVDTERWLEALQARPERREDDRVVALDAKSPASVTRLRRALLELTAQRRGARTLVVGIPNAGKSTVINGLIGRAVARTEDRAGVTRAAQWFRVPGTAPNTRVEIMDTAGILVPRIDTSEARWKLALVGAVPRARFDAEEVVTRFATWAEERARNEAPTLAAFAASHGFVRHGTELDLHNAAWSYIKAFSAGRFGRLTLETALAAS